MTLRLGLDIGTNSIGWWLFEANTNGICRSIDGGVRIFSDGREPARGDRPGTPLAALRREKRSMRRRRDRYLRRRAALMRKLADAGLMPPDPGTLKDIQTLDPFELRARALDAPLTLHEFGRAIFHLNQRRGFKSNRKTDRGDNEATKISAASSRLDQAMMTEGARTFGEFLHKRRQVIQKALSEQNALSRARQFRSLSGCKLPFVVSTVHPR